MLTPQEIAERLVAQFGAKIHDSIVDDLHPRVHIAASAWLEVAKFLKTDPELQFDWLACLTGVDYVADDQFAVVVDLTSTVYGHRFAVKIIIPRSEPVVPSVAGIWSAANWHEREAYDLFGIEFANHPDPRRILMMDDWQGFPLRKDYVFPRQVHGIPGSVELDWQQKPELRK